MWERTPNRGSCRRRRLLRIFSFAAIRQKFEEMLSQHLRARSEAERSEAKRSQAQRSEAERSETERSKAERSEAERASAERAEAERSTTLMLWRAMRGCEVAISQPRISPNPASPEKRIIALWPSPDTIEQLSE